MRRLLGCIILTGAFAACSSNSNGGSGNGGNSGGNNNNNNNANLPAVGSTVSGCNVAITGSVFLADIQPFSDNSQVFQNIDYAVQMAVNEINAGGGLHSQTLGLLQCDDQGTASVGASVVQTLATNPNVVGVVGGAFSSTAAAIAPLLATSHTVVVSPTATSPSLSAISPYFFRTCPSDALQGAVDAAIAKRQGFHKVFVAYRNDAYGTGLSNSFVSAFASLGDSNSMAYDPNSSLSSQFSAVVAAAQAYGADAIFPASNRTDGEAVITAMVSPTTPWAHTPGFIFGDALDDPTLPTDLGTAESYIEGAFGTVPSTPTGSVYGDFAQRFVTAWGTPPTAYDANGYDAAYLLAIALQATASPASGAAVQAALAANIATSGTTPVQGGAWANIVAALKSNNTLSYQGASGPVVFDSSNDATSDIQEWTVQNSSVVNVAASATGGCWLPTGVPCNAN